jgi:hypothetical protein
MQGTRHVTIRDAAVPKSAAPAAGTKTGSFPSVRIADTRCGLSHQTPVTTAIGQVCSRTGEARTSDSLCRSGCPRRRKWFLNGLSLSSGAVHVYGFRTPPGKAVSPSSLASARRYSCAVAVAAACPCPAGCPRKVLSMSGGVPPQGVDHLSALAGEHLPRAKPQGARLPVFRLHRNCCSGLPVTRRSHPRLRAPAARLHRAIRGV